MVSVSSSSAGEGKLGHRAEDRAGAAPGGPGRKPVHGLRGTGGGIDKTLNVRTDGMGGPQSGESHDLTVRVA